jgi:DUF177 domain-containing protein
MYIININSLKTDPEDFSSVLPKKAFDLGQDAQLLQDVVVQFQIHRMNDQVFVCGKVSAQVNVKCARCLCEYDAKVQGELFLLAMPKRHPVMNHEAEKELQPDDPAIIYYTGDQLDLQPEIQGVLLLALPMKPLCQDDCFGLCVNCGERLRGKTCDCQQTYPQGPFSVLKDFKK